MSLGSNGVDWVHSLQKILMRIHGTNSALIALVQPVLRQVSCDNQTVPNAPKQYKTHKESVQDPMGWIGSVHCEKFRCDFMAQTCALIGPVQPVLHRVSCSNEILTNTPKYQETHTIMSLGSDGVDWVHSLRKILMRIHGTNFCINCTSSTRFAPSFVQ